MKRAYINGILLDGTQQMEPQAHKVLLCEDGVITAVADEGTDLDGYEVIDLHGGYAMPGLVNLHVHLAGNGKPSAKPRDVQLCKAGAAGRRDHHPHRGRHRGF